MARSFVLRHHNDEEQLLSEEVRAGSWLERQWFDILRDAERLEVRLEPSYQVHSDAELWQLVRSAVTHRQDPLHLLHGLLEQQAWADRPSSAANSGHRESDLTPVNESMEDVARSGSRSARAIRTGTPGWAPRLLAEGRLSP